MPSASISSNFASKAKNVQILNMSKFTLFGDQTFRGRICKIKLAEISRTYLNKHYGVKIISIGPFVWKYLPKICSFRRLFYDVKNAKTVPISWRCENDGFIMTHKLKTETFSLQIVHSGGVIFLPLTPLYSFVTFHLKSANFGIFLPPKIGNQGQ